MTHISHNSEVASEVTKGVKYTDDQFKDMLSHMTELDVSCFSIDATQSVKFPETLFFDITLKHYLLDTDLKLLQDLGITVVMFKPKSNGTLELACWIDHEDLCMESVYK